MALQSKQVDLSVDTLVKILEVIAPLKHFDKVRTFLQLKLPEGFPVKLGHYFIYFRTYENYLQSFFQGVSQNVWF